MGCMNKLIKKLSRHFEIFNETRRIRRCYELHIVRIRNRRAGTKIKVLTEYGHIELMDGKNQ
jgi:hypothetical protein